MRNRSYTRARRKTRTSSKIRSRSWDWCKNAFWASISWISMATSPTLTIRSSCSRMKDRQITLAKKGQPKTWRHYLKMSIFCTRIWSWTRSANWAPLVIISSTPTHLAVMGQRSRLTALLAAVAGLQAPARALKRRRDPRQSFGPPPKWTRSASSSWKTGLTAKCTPLRKKIRMHFDLYKL